jgi:hypothetical protein
LIRDFRYFPNSASFSSSSSRCGDGGGNAWVLGESAAKGLSSAFLGEVGEVGEEGAIGLPRRVQRSRRVCVVAEVMSWLQRNTSIMS